MFGLSDETILKQNAAATVEEIARQPRVWGEIYEAVEERKAEIREFFKNIDNDTRIIFTGAGSSGFIGDSLVPAVRGLGYGRVESIHTTDIVAYPEQYLIPGAKTVLVSFGRSGNSPESVACVRKADEQVGDLRHVIITCNSGGALAQYKNENVFNITMDQLHDRGFAMTSSQTGMTLAAFLIFGYNNDYGMEVGHIRAAVEKAMSVDYAKIADLAALDYDRLIVLGAGNLYGTAKEAALKNIELSAGKVMAWHDTPMGFRHGPKSLLNEKTLILYFLSSNPYTKRYDYDMLRELSNAESMKLAVISDGYDETACGIAGEYFFAAKESGVSDAFITYYPLAAAQILALLRSVNLGLTPDNPFPGGEVNRVVAGVTVY